MGLKFFLRDFLVRKILITRGLFTYSMKQKMILGVSSVVSEKGLIFGMFFFWGGGEEVNFCAAMVWGFVGNPRIFFLRGGGVG